MNDAISSSLSSRREFLRAAAWLACSAGLVFGRGKALASEPETGGCSAEIDKLKKAAGDRYFEGVDWRALHPASNDMGRRYLLTRRKVQPPATYNSAAVTLEP